MEGMATIYNEVMPNFTSSNEFRFPFFSLSVLLSFYHVLIDWSHSLILDLRVPQGMFDFLWYT